MLARAAACPAALRTAAIGLTGRDEARRPRWRFGACACACGMWQHLAPLGLGYWPYLHGLLTVKVDISIPGAESVRQASAELARLLLELAAEGIKPGQLHGSALEAAELLAAPSRAMPALSAPRLPGETDAAYRRRAKAKRLAHRVTPEKLLRFLRELLCLAQADARSVDQ